MSSERLHRKDLKAPDEFVTFTARALGYAQENRRRVLVAGMAFLGLVAFVLSVQGYRSWRDTQVRAVYADASAILASEAWRDAAEAFEGIASGWPTHPLTGLALVHAGNARARAGDRTEAITAFERLHDTTDEALLRDLAAYNLGVLMRSEDPTRAVESLRAAAESPGPFRGPAVVALAAEGPSTALPEGATEGLPEDLRPFVSRHLEGLP